MVNILDTLNNKALAYSSSIPQIVLDAYTVFLGSTGQFIGTVKRLDDVQLYYKTIHLLQFFKQTIDYLYPEQATGVKIIMSDHISSIVENLTKKYADISFIKNI